MMRERFPIQDFILITKDIWIDFFCISVFELIYFLFGFRLGVPVLNNSKCYGETKTSSLTELKMNVIKI
jgi:hypothetical protein